MVSEIITPVFSALALPNWYSSWFSLIVVIGLIGLVGILAYRAIGQSLKIAVDSNHIRGQVEQEKRKFESYVEQSPQSIFITDLDGKIKYVNPKFTEIMGFSADEIYGKTPQIFKTEFTPSEFYPYLWETITSGEKWVGEFITRRKDNSVIYEFAVITPLTNFSGKKTHYVAFENDISLHKEMAFKSTNGRRTSGEIKRAVTVERTNTGTVTTGPLTGLYNRVYLSEILPREVLRSLRARNHLILMIIDVDHFRMVNEKYGHSTGDLVLAKISKSITESMDRYDLAFRYGGDEFLLLFYAGETNEFGMTRAEQLRSTFEKHIILSDQQEISVTVSIGLAVYPVHGKNEDELLMNAEKALEISGNPVEIKLHYGWIMEVINEQT